MDQCVSQSQLTDTHIEEYVLASKIIAVHLQAVLPGLNKLSPYFATNDLITRQKQ
jgi:hypothetical protein